MLAHSKSITITGTSSVNGIDVMTFNATVSTSGGSNSSTSSMVLREELYKENRVEVREDQEAFRKLVYSVEDSIVAEQSEVAPKE